MGLSILLAQTIPATITTEQLLELTYLHGCGIKVYDSVGAASLHDFELTRNIIVYLGSSCQEAFQVGERLFFPGVRKHNYLMMHSFETEGETHRQLINGYWTDAPKTGTIVMGPVPMIYGCEQYLLHLERFTPQLLEANVAGIVITDVPRKDYTIFAASIDSLSDFRKWAKHLGYYSDIREHVKPSVSIFSNNLVCFIRNATHIVINKKFENYDALNDLLTKISVMHAKIIL